MKDKKKLKKIKVKVNGGKLIAIETGNPDFPGILLLYEPDDSNGIDLALAEVPNGQTDVSVYTYEDVKSDDWTRKYTLSRDEILEALKFEDEEEPEDE